MRTSLATVGAASKNSNMTMSNATGTVALYSTSSNLGVGLTTAAYALDVTGSLRTSSDVYSPGFSNVGTNTYVSTLTCSGTTGTAGVVGQLTASGGIFGAGFSNTVAGGGTYTSVLCNVGTISAPGFSNVAGTTYVSTLACSGAAQTAGQLTSYGGLYGSGFSNVAASSCTYTSVLSNSGAASFGGAAAFGGTVSASNGLYGSGFSNVATAAKITYTTTLSNAGDVVCGGNVSAGNVGVFRNRIINGDMRFNQRYAGNATNPASLPSGAGYTLDRWNVWVPTTNVSLAVQRVAASVSGSTLLGFQYACQLSSTAATTTLASGDLAVIGQVIEGNNISDLGWGTSAALSVVVSFWVYCNASGTYSVNLAGGGNLTLTLPFSVTSGGWQRVVMTIPGPTTGTWATNNTLGVLVRIVLAAGSTYFIASNGAWLTSGIGASGQSNFFASLANKMWITGFQFEKGTNNNATPFEYRPYAVELQLCQRYYEKSYEVDTVPGSVTFVGAQHQRVQSAGYFTFTFPPVTFKVLKRVPPTTAGNLLAYNPFTSAVNTWYSDVGGSVTPIGSPLSTGVDTYLTCRGAFSCYATQTWTLAQAAYFQWTCETEL